MQQSNGWTPLTYPAAANIAARTGYPIEAIEEMHRIGARRFAWSAA
jgi:hypothetical protein